MSAACTDGGQRKLDAGEKKIKTKNTLRVSDGKERRVQR